MCIRSEKVEKPWTSKLTSIYLAPPPSGDRMNVMNVGTGLGCSYVVVPLLQEYSYLGRHEQLVRLSWLHFLPAVFQNSLFSACRLSSSSYFFPQCTSVGATLVHELHIICSRTTQFFSQYEIVVAQPADDWSIRTNNIHDFLPPLRRGSHVKSDNTNTSINIHPLAHILDVRLFIFSSFALFTVFPHRIM